MDKIKVKIKKLRPDAYIPTKAHKNDAGYDLYAVDRVVLKPFERKVIPIGISIEIPEGYYGRVAPRSGHAVKSGIDVMAGVVDATFRGQVGVVLINLAVLGSELNPSQETVLFGGKNDFVIKPGDKIAQIIFEKIGDAEFEEVNEHSETDRGSGGYGSTGN